MKLFRRKKRIVNILITDYAIRFLELASVRPLKIERYGERLIPPGILHRGDILDAKELGLILENCVTDWKLKRLPMRFLLPDSFVALKEEKVDIDLKDDEINAHLFMEIGVSIHLPFENPVFDTAVTAIEDGKKHLLLLAAPEEKVSAFVKLFEEAGLNPIAADVSPLALYRFYYEKIALDENAHYVLLHIQEKMATVSIFHHHQPKFMKPISFDVPDYVGADAFMDVFSELDKVINFYENSLHKGEVRMSGMLLNNELAEADAFTRSLTERYSMPVYGDEAFSMYDQDGQLLPPGFYAPLGLALKGR